MGQDATAIFRDRAAGYERMAWHDRYARALVAGLKLSTGQTVVDAGAGTGFAARALARRIGPAGRVIAVELTPAMVERFDADAGPGSAPIEAVIGDATRLDLPDSCVDAVVCSAALLYMPVQTALAEWHRVLRPGGLVGFSTMRAAEPPAGALFRRLALGRGLHIEDPSAALGSEDACTAALIAAGFAAPRVLGGTVHFAEADLAGAWAAHERGAREQLATLSAADRDTLRDRYEAELSTLTDRHTARVLYAQGRRPGRTTYPGHMRNPARSAAGDVKGDDTAATRSDIEQVLALERELQTPAVRRDARLLSELLAPGFIEVGASGRLWDRTSVVEMLAAEAVDPDAEAIGMSDVEARVLTDGVIQVFWISDRAGRRARRTSLWQRTADGWQQTYHQGTPLPE